MNNDQQQTMMAFIQWLPQNAQQFEGSIPKDIIDPIAAAQSPEEVVNVLNQLSQSQEGTQIVSVMFQAFQESQKAGMFAKGGKLNYLVQKYQNAAGNLPKKDNTFMREIRDFGDTTDTKIYNYRTDYRKTYPNGSVIMQSATPSDMSTYYDPRRPKPSFWTRLLYLFPPAAPKSMLENWDELERNHKNDIPVLDKTRKIRQ